jgi:phytoene dehydrogenase-like protein
MPCPPTPGGRDGDWAGLQSYVDTLEGLSRGFAAAEARRLPEDPVPTYAFTPSALDDSLAPAGTHTMYLACPSAPFALDGGWDAHQHAFAERMIDTLEARVPGFRGTIRGMAIRTPQDMAAELRWPGAHPMYGDLSRGASQLPRRGRCADRARYLVAPSGCVTAGTTAA